MVGGGLAGWLTAAVATAGILVFWGLLMAPKAKRRLATTPRLVVSALLCLFTADGLLRVGYPWWGGFVGIAGIAVVAAQVALPQADPERADRRRADRGQRCVAKPCSAPARVPTLGRCRR